METVKSASLKILHSLNVCFQNINMFEIIDLKYILGSLSYRVTFAQFVSSQSITIGVKRKKFLFCDFLKESCQLMMSTWRKCKCSPKTRKHTVLNHGNNPDPLPWLKIIRVVSTLMAYIPPSNAEPYPCQLQLSIAILPFFYFLSMMGNKLLLTNCH